MDGVHYWRSHGHEWPSILRALAQTVFDALASVVVMERDSCIADTFIPRKHGGVDTTNLEMALYLRGQFNYIPKTFPSLATKRRRTPPRIDLKTCVKEVQVLGFNVSDTGQNGRGLVFRKGTLQARTAEPWCSRTGTLQDKRPRPDVRGRGHYRPRFPARLTTGWPRRLLILLSNTPQIMWCCSGSPVLFFAVVALVVYRRRRVIFLRGAVYDGRIGQAF